MSVTKQYAIVGSKNFPTYPFIKDICKSIISENGIIHTGCSLGIEKQVLELTLLGELPFKSVVCHAIFDRSGKGKNKDSAYNIVASLASHTNSHVNFTSLSNTKRPLKERLHKRIISTVSNINTACIGFITKGSRSLEITEAFKYCYSESVYKPYLILFPLNIKEDKLPLISKCGRWIKTKDANILNSDVWSKSLVWFDNGG